MELNPEQSSAVEAQDSRVLVLASPGSGKTFTLIHRIAHLIESGVSPYSICAVTFTNKAGQEMRKRLKELLGRRGRGLTIKTFHSLAYSMVSQFSATLGYSGNITIYAEYDREDILDDCKKKLGWRGTKKSLLQNWEKYAEGEEVEDREFSILLGDYLATLRQHNALDYDSLLLTVNRLLRDYEEAREHFRTKWKHVLVDEAQDTNTVQYDFLDLLDPENLFLVGDQDQCLYSWRGARPDLFLERAEQGFRIIKLERCYRCPIPVAEGANRLISHNENRFEKRIVTDKEGRHVHEIMAGDPEILAEKITSWIRQDVKSENVPARDIFVLSRTNWGLSVFAPQLDKYEIPYQLLSSHDDLFTVPSVARLIHGLELLHNPQNDYAAENSIFAWSSSPEVLQDMKLRALRERKFLSEILRGLDDRTNEFFEQFSTQDDTFDAVFELEKAFGLTSKLGPLKTQAQKVWEFIEFLHDWRASSASASVESFLEWRWGRALQDGLKLDEDSVKLMTIHGAKGLEAPHVYIIGLEEGVFPSKRSPIEEERRLMFVAMTRAEETLTVCSSSMRKIPRSEKLILAEPSRFLKEIKEDGTT